MKIAFDKVEEQAEFKTLPEGQYPVLVVSTEEGISSKKETPFIKIKMEIMEGEFQGKFIWDTFFLTEKAFPRLKTSLKNMGVDTTGDLEVDGDLFNGKTALCEVEHDHYTDKDGKEKTIAKPIYAAYSIWDPGIPADVDGNGYEVEEEEEYNGDVPF